MIWMALPRQRKHPEPWRKQFLNTVELLPLIWVCLWRRLGHPRSSSAFRKITLIALLAVGYFGHQRQFKYKKQTRWVAMLVGIIVLGFLYNKPLTISMVNQALLGFWPQWQTNLCWYMLLGGIILVFTVDNKNPYCVWFCPFGAAQECMGVIGGAKVRSPGRKSRNVLKWTQRDLAWLAIVIALWFRNPGISSYAIFGT
jgi:hypothetical protein